MNYNNGAPIPVSEVEDFEQAALEWSEGNEELRTFLLRCNELGIETTACCGGHPDENGEMRLDVSPYIAFAYKPELRGFFERINAELSPDKFHFNVGVGPAERPSTFALNYGDSNGIIIKVDVQELFRRLRKVLEEYHKEGTGANVGTLSVVFDVTDEFYRSFANNEWDAQEYDRILNWYTDEGKFCLSVVTNNENLLAKLAEVGFVQYYKRKNNNGAGMKITGTMDECTEKLAKIIQR